jgi:large subunit ribosomal protein L33
MQKKSVKKKRAAILFKLVSSAGTGYFFTARRNPKKRPDKMEFRKYDPITRSHVMFREAKLEF